MEKVFIIDCHRHRCEMKDVVREDCNKCPMCRSKAIQKITIIRCQPKEKGLLVN